jgi:hypothetical protein
MRRHLTETEINFILKMMRDEIPKTRVIKILKTEGRTFKRMTEELGFYYPNFKKRLIHYNPFENLQNKDVQYWLGWLGTDGYINFKEGTVKLAVSIKDIDIIEKFRNFINPKLKILHKIHHKKYEQVEISFKNHEITNFLKENAGFCENKTFNYYPTFKIDKNYIRGVFEGDGYLRWGKTCEFCIVGASNKHIDILNDWFIKKGFHPKVRKRLLKSGKNFYIISLFRKQEIKDLLDLIYEDADIYLERKYQLARLVRNDKRKDLKLGEIASTTPSQASEEIPEEGVTTLRGPLSM